MKNKAFTLIELLGVIMILGVLVLIAFPPLLKQIKNTKKGISDATKSLIIDAAKDYYEENKANYERVEGMTYCIEMNTLVQNNNVNPKLKDHELNDIDTTKKIKMIYHNKKFDYDISDTCQNNSLTRNNIEVPIVTEDSGLYKSTIDQDKFIYRGENPNNYITLKEDGENNTTYRIISFENDGTIKVVRNERSIDGFDGIAWDERTSTTTGPRKNENNSYCNYLSSNVYQGCNVWGNQTNTYYNGSTLQSLTGIFNFKYYPSSTSDHLEDSSKNGTVIVDSSLNTYLNNSWYNSLAFKDKIDEHSFSVGGIYYFKGDEDAKGIKKENAEKNAFTWNGKVGLLDIIDFVETSTNNECVSVYSNYRYNYPNYYYQGEGESEKTEHAPANNNYPCKNSNWTYKPYTQFSISVISSSRGGIWAFVSSGYFNHANASSTYAVHPTFYLKSDISLIGEGTEANPYKIQ